MELTNVVSSLSFSNHFQLAIIVTKGLFVLNKLVLVYGFGLKLRFHAL